MAAWVDLLKLRLAVIPQVYETLRRALTGPSLLISHKHSYAKVLKKVKQNMANIDK
jgi:hypothetical protein